MKNGSYWRHDFSNEWHKFMHPAGRPADQALTMQLVKGYYTLSNPSLLKTSPMPWHQPGGWRLGWIPAPDLSRLIQRLWKTYF